jgi:hypothetical protein
MMRVATVESLLYDWLMLVLESHVHSQRHFGIYPTQGEGNATADGVANGNCESFRDLPVREWSVAHVADFLNEVGLRSAAAAAERAQVRILPAAVEHPTQPSSPIVLEVLLDSGRLFLSAQVDGPTLVQMRREDAKEELQLSKEQASALVDELGLLLGLDALDRNGEGALSKGELIRGIGESPDVAALFGLSQCYPNGLHQLFPDVHDDERLSRALWAPLVRAARSAEQQREAECQRHEAEAAAIEAAKKAAELAAAQMQKKLKEDMEVRLNKEHAKFEKLQREIEELRQCEAVQLADLEVRPLGLPAVDSLVPFYVKGLATFLVL